MMILIGSAYPPIGRILAGDFKRDSTDVKKIVENYKDANGEPVPYFAYNKGL